MSRVAGTSVRTEKSGRAVPGDSSRGAGDLSSEGIPKNGHTPGNRGGGIGASGLGRGTAAGAALTGSGPG